MSQAGKCVIIQITKYKHGHIAHIRTRTPCYADDDDDKVDTSSIAIYFNEMHSIQESSVNISVPATVIHLQATLVQHIHSARIQLYHS